MPIRSIAAPPVAQQQHTMGFGIVFHAMVDPPMFYAVAAELACIAAEVEVHVPLVACQIIDSVRDQFAISCAAKIVIVCVHRDLRVSMATSGKVANQLLFLGVNADDGFFRIW